MATAQAAVVVVVAAGCSGAGVAAGSGVVAASSGASPPSPKVLRPSPSRLLGANACPVVGPALFIHPAPTHRKHPPADL